MDSETISFIRKEIARQLQIILPASAGANDQQTETISQMYPGMPDIVGRPVMHPYGIASRAPAGTQSLIAQLGEHMGNKMVIGHRDSNRPAIGSGESVLYDAYGHLVYCSKTKMQFGSMSSDENMVLGKTFQAAFSAFLGAFLGHTHEVLAPGAMTLIPDPGTISSVNNIKSSPVDDKKMLSQKAFTEN